MIRVQSPANIAFLKYWGQRDAALTLPCNDSFSMNLSQCYTTVALVPDDDPSVQTLEITEYQKNSPRPATEDERARVVQFHQTVVQFLQISEDNHRGFRITSANSFPQKAGIASSASFFSAMAMAFARLYHADLDEQRLSRLARLSGSGSASRSVPDGFVWWQHGTGDEDSFATSIASPDFWDLRDIVVLVHDGEKKVSSTQGHHAAQTSPFFQQRIDTLLSRAAAMKQAFLDRDFEQFGMMVEQEMVQFHSIMMTQQPPLWYWTEETLRVIKHIHQLREDGLMAYVTLDAGAHLHVICQAADVEQLVQKVSAIAGVRGVIVNQPTIGTRVRDDRA